MSSVLLLSESEAYLRTMMVSKSLQGLGPEYLSSKLERSETAYNLRDSENKVNVPLPRTNYYQSSFSFSGAVLWSSLAT